MPRKKPRKARFAPITFRSLEELNEFGNYVESNYGWRHLESYECTDNLYRRYFSKPSRQLRTWAKKHRISICADGADKILDNTGAGSWKEYFRKNWNDQETRIWFKRNIRCIGNRSYPDSLRVYSGWADNTPPCSSWDETLKALGKVKWAKWPFGRATHRPSQKRKVRKK